MDKAPDAFRTISEVAEVLETPAHVLRFWESRFPQIKPVKRAGGRRYYRPADVALLSGIRQLLHTEGMTIRGVQKVLREQGVRHVALLGGDVSDLDLEVDLELEADLVVPAPMSPPRVVVPMTRRQPEPVRQNTATERMPASEPPEPEVPVVSAAQVAEPVTPRAFPGTPPIGTPIVPREGEGGFIAFSNPRKARHRTMDDPQQPTLPFEGEAPHIWAEPEPPLAAEVTTLRPEPEAPVFSPDAASEAKPKAAAVAKGSAADAGTSHADDASEVPELAGISARLRQLSQPLASERTTALAELHSRLGLFQANDGLDQIASQ